MDRATCTINASASLGVDFDSAANPESKRLLDDAAWLRERYETDGLTLTELADELVCAHSTVLHALARHGIARRPRGPRPIHGHARAGAHTPTYRCWQSMLARTTNPAHPDHGSYGGRGITVCERWREPNGHGFRNFLADMGERPDGTSLDRIDNDRGYYPANCRWATPSEQAQNRWRSWALAPLRWSVPVHDEPISRGADR